MQDLQKMLHEIARVAQSARFAGNLRQNNCFVFFDFWLFMQEL